MSKILKETQNISMQDHQDQVIRNNQSQPTFGIAFDIDGVLARGTLPLEQAKRAMNLLVNSRHEFQVPVAFVTNSLNTNQDKANQLCNWFKTPVSMAQMVQAQGPLEVFKQYHNKHCLFVGQGKIREIAKDLGFTNICVLDQIKAAYPLLDMVDHDNRRKVAREGGEGHDFPRVEAIVLLGEPKRWESYLQVLVDLLKTDGKPDVAPKAVPEKHLPIIACNMDLQFSDRACMPRYGHGAFLLCLEALYKKVTGYEMRYTSLVGKPSEVTFRYAEHCLSKEAKRLGYEEPLERMYIIGDTPEADIVGGNLYMRYIQRLKARRSKGEVTRDLNKNEEEFDPELPMSRNVPSGTIFLKQTIKESSGILVCTGCYNPTEDCEVERGDEKNYRGHRDFPFQPELYDPETTVDSVFEAVTYILEKEGYENSSH